MYHNVEGGSGDISRLKVDAVDEAEMYGARLLRQNHALDDAIGFNACS
jgi:hypothetical protein